ncbi:MAG: hypothetical protein U0939_16560 [Pirellulales bacterium]
MEFRRSGQSNQRRRRVLKEDASSAADEPSEATPRRRRRAGGAHQRPYTDAALAEHQARVTDLIPKRPWTLLVLVLSLLAAVSLVQALYAHRDLGARWVGEHNLAALDPTTRGSLSAWLSSAMLGAAAVASVSVFSIRRHRIDDYKGRYRLWLTAAVVCLLASIDATTDLHRVPRHVLDVVARNYAGGTSLGEYTRFWWVVFNLTFVVVAAGRLSIEMRRSVGAATWLVAAAAGYMLVGAVELGYIGQNLGFVTVLLQSSAKMLGDAALLFAIGTYARYVYLDSQGILAQRRAEREARRRKAQAEREARRQAKAEAKAAAAAEKAAAKEARRSAKNAVAAKAEEADEADEESSEEEVPEQAFTEKKPSPAPAPKPTPPAAAKPTPAPAPPPSNDDDEEEDDEYGDDRNMSRAERKRLKKLGKRKAA